MAELFEAFALRLRETDNVAVARRPLRAGTALNGSLCLTASRDIPAGHKIALAEIETGQPILKYGQLIGYARSKISPGDHVHTHNVAMREDADDRTRLPHVCCADFRPNDFYPPSSMRTFPAYARGDGRVGTRNYVGVISSVNCSA